MSHYPAVAAPGDNRTVSLRRLLRHDSPPADQSLVLLFCFTSLSGIQEAVAIHAAVVTDLDVLCLSFGNNQCQHALHSPKVDPAFGAYGMLGL